MKGFALGLSLSIAFILGCAAAPFVVPRMSAQQQAAGVQRWEYACLNQRSYQADVGQLNEMGAQGWEMAPSRGTSEFCFKRPL